MIQHSVLISLRVKKRGRGLFEVVWDFITCVWEKVFE